MNRSRVEAHYKILFCAIMIMSGVLLNTFLVVSGHTLLQSVWNGMLLGLVLGNWYIKG